MRIIADENIPLLDAYFSAFGEVEPVNGRHLNATQVADADVLLVRSVTQVNEALLQGSRLAFVGTCTIGTDHLDIDYLQGAGVHYASAPGCNAGGVVQYVLRALTHLRRDWRQLKVGIVGCGNVGGRLYRTLRELGVRCVGYDPFLGVDSGIDLVGFEQILQCDVICVHTPLTRTGPHPTLHMFNGQVLAQLKPGALLLNAGRGGAIDNAALLSCLEAGADLEVVLDVWENEPAISVPLGRGVAVGTPHIAGYSSEGRINGSIMICRALAHFLGWRDDRIKAHLASVAAREGERPGEITADSLEDALAQSYDLPADHQRLMDVLEASESGGEALAVAFDSLRKQYPVRHEPNFYRVRLPHETAADPLRAVGFQVEQPE